MSDSIIIPDVRWGGVVIMSLVLRQQPDPAFQIIDAALAKYYQRLGYSNYRDNNGNGLFLNYVIDEELNDPDLPPERELGDDCDPNNCAYSLMINETEFPIPHYVVIPAQTRRAFIFYVLQYCYKTQKPPSDQYIQQTLIPKCGGSINHNLLQMTMNQNDDNNTIQSPSIQPG